MHFLRLKQTFRLLIKEKQITLINIAGLSISLACTLFIILWVQDELGYDRFHEDHKRLYRVEEDQYYSGKEPYHVNVTPYVSGPVWKEEVPEVEEQCRMAYTGKQLITYGDHRFYEDGIASVDSTFFRMFTFPLKFGNGENALTEPASIVLSEEVARKYFGNENPVGASLEMNVDRIFTVTGVLEKMPRNTVIGFDFLVPWQYIESQPWYTENWGTNSIRTFVKLKPGSIDTVVDRKITEVTNIHKENNTIDYSLAPLSGVHLHSYFGYGHSPGAILYVYIFSAIALFVLLIACINFMNLSTARSSSRAKEIGLKKLAGASTGLLARQHLFESFIQILFAVFIAILVALLLLGTFNRITGKEIQMIRILSPQYLSGIGILLVLTAFLAGTYPAFYLSSLKPVRSIKEHASSGKTNGRLRRVMVVLQFSLAVLLIAGSMVASRQLTYMQKADLHFDKQNLLHIELRGKLNLGFERLKEELQRDPRIISATASIQPPYQIGSNSSGIDWEGKDPEQDILVSYTGVHYDFIKTMGISLASGRDFSAGFPGDMYRDTTAGFIINRTLAEMISEGDVTGMELRFMGLHGQIAGVMEDYHFNHLRNEIEPMAIAPLPQSELRHMIIRLSGRDQKGALDFVETTWETLNPDYPLEYDFVDQVIASMYSNEEKLAKLLRIFTLVAIVISCLGLFALASFSASRRHREIGIRKTMGAMDQQIALMMIRDLSLYILISMMIALPGIWITARMWLNDFSFRIPLKPDLFISTALITSAVAVLTVLFHALKSAHTNPVEALRYE